MISVQNYAYCFQMYIQTKLYLLYVWIDLSNIFKFIIYILSLGEGSELRGDIMECFWRFYNHSPCMMLYTKREYFRSIHNDPETK